MNKKLPILFIALVLSIYCTAQTPKPDSAIINANAVSAFYIADGTQNFKYNAPAYFVPQGPLHQATIYCGALWVGGLDAGHNLHVAAQTYHQLGTDYWPGPIMDSLSYSKHEDTLWNHVWVIRKSTIDSFRAGKFGHTVPPSIANWPGNGNVALGEMKTLAPYVDSAHYGTYDPYAGDYPLIRGDEALYMIFNDDRGASHTESKGKKLGIEVHLMVYQFKNADTAINEATFMHYDIYNLSKNDYDSIYLGNWIDMDVGNGANNFIGCDSASNYWYTYCASTFDPDGTGQYAGENGYLSLPPAQSLAYMCDTMTHFMYYNNDFSMQGNPGTAFEYYNYMHNVWRDSSHSTYGGSGYGGSTPSNYMYSGSVLPLTGWSEVSAGDVKGDRRGISSTGPYTLKSKTGKSLDVALVFAQHDSNNNLASVALLNPYISRVKSFYNSQSYSCDETMLGVPASTSIAKVVNSVLAYPNPASTEITFKMSLGENQYIKIYDITGRELSTSPILNNQVQINVSAYTSGIYIYEVLDKSGNTVNRGKFSVLK